MSRDEARAVCMKGAHLCDIIVGNDEEFAVLAGGDGGDGGERLAGAMAQEHNRVVIYKMGACGCRTFHGKEHFFTPPFSVNGPQADRCGRRLHGRTDLRPRRGGKPARRRAPWCRHCRIVVTRVGCAPAMPDAAEVHAFLSRSAR